MQTEDGSLIYKCLNGEPETFSLLVDKYKTGIYSFAYARLGNFHDAQDVTQEVFIQAYTNLRNLQKWDRFVFWLYRIASAQCAKWIRTQIRRKDKEFIEDQDPKILDMPSIDSYREDQVNESLKESLEALPEAYRDVLTLHYIGGLKVMEIAKALSISPSTIARRLREARSQLREEMFTMMNETYEQHRLPVSFTFRIVEAIKHIKIHPTSTIKGLPWGLSLATGIIIAVMSLNPYLSWFSQIGTYVRSVLPSETKVLKIGEIPVDVVKISSVAVLSSKMGKGKGGELKPDMQNAFFMAPQGEGNTIVKKADMPTARWCLSASVVDGKIYAIGGNDANIEVYDPKADTWVSKGWPVKGLGTTPTEVVDGIIYFLGGAGDQFVSTVYSYNPDTEELIKKTNMPTARAYHCAIAVNGKIYAIGGTVDANANALTSVEEYDPATDTWTKKANLHNGRWFFTTSVLNGKIYAFGGYGTNQTTLSSVEEYDPATDTWTKKNDMPIPRRSFSTSAANGKVYAFGGRSPGAFLSSIDEYNPIEDKWTKKTDMAFPRWLLSTVVVDGRIYAIGGQSMAADSVTTVEEYTPEGWPFAVSPNGKLPKTWGMMKYNK